MATPTEKLLILTASTALLTLNTSADFAGGTGSNTNPYQISTCQQLQNIQNDLEANYELVNDIDCSGFGFSSVGDNSFTGVLDGQGYLVKNLEISESSSNQVGLFEELGTDAEIKNIGLVNADITGDDDLGGLVGRSRGNVSNSYVTGSISATAAYDDHIGGLVGDNDGGNIFDSYSNASVTGDDDVGGLVGRNDGSVSGSYSNASVNGNGNVGGLVGRTHGSGSVSGSYSNASVNGGHDVGALVGENSGSVSGSYSNGVVTGSSDVGGLVGQNGGGSVSSSYSTGSVTGSSYAVGALVGDNYQGSVSGSYSTGSVTGTTHVGGLVGDNYLGSVSGSYSTGSVTGNSNVGGLLGRTHGDGSVSSSYWDKETSGQSSSDGGAGLTTSEMRGRTPCDTMSGLDFTNTWYAQSGDYPGLRAFESNPSNLNCPPDPSFTFTPSDPVIGESLTLSASGSSDPDGDSLSYVWSGDVSGSGPSISKSFTSRGDKTVTLTVSDGNGGTDTLTKTVSVVNRPPDASISITPSNPSIGGSVTLNASGSVDLDGDSLSYVWSGDVSGSGPDISESFSSPGVYSATVTVSDGNGGSDSVTKVFSYGFAGGNGSSGNPLQISTCAQLQGMQADLDADYELVNDVDCSSFGRFSGVGDYDNRFTGVLDGQGYVIQNLTPKRYGLIEYMGSGGEIKNIGLVNVDVDNPITYDVGGLVGLNKGTITDSFTTGDVYGAVDVGGLVGDNDGSVIDSYSTSSVTGSYDVGGLVGENRGSVNDSYSTGSIIGIGSPGTGDLGGLIGAKTGGSVSSSYWDKESSGQSSSDGGTGLTTSEMQGSAAESNMPGLDFTNNWTTISSSDSDTTGDGYPILQGLDRQSQLEAQGINFPPTAAFTSDSPVTTGEGFGLNASDSSDPDGDSLNYYWDIDDDGNYDDQTGKTPSVTKTEAGTYTISLKVNDSNGGSDTTSNDIYVSASETFRRAEIEVPDRYTTISTTTGTKKSLTFTITNPSTRQKDLNVSLNGINASFETTTQTPTKKQINIEPGKQKQLQAIIQPQTPGNKKLTINASNTNTLLNNKRTIPINNQQPTTNNPNPNPNNNQQPTTNNPDNPNNNQQPTTNTRQIPGITTPYILLLITTATLIHWHT